MFYSLDLSHFPKVAKVYSVTRKTVWQVADPYNIFIYVEKGSCLVEINGEERKVEEGSIFFIPEGQSYKRSPDGDTFCTMTYIHFKSGEVIPLLAEELKSEIIKRRDGINKSILENGTDESPYAAYISECCGFNGKENEFSEAFTRLRNNFSRHHIESGFKTSLALCEILGLMTEETRDRIKAETRIEKAVPPNLRRALSFIKQNYTEEITLSDIAKHSSVTKQQIIRYFRKELKTTPMSYVTCCRLNRAKELFLNKSYQTVGEVASEVGFSDVHYFSRVFKKINGETPSEFIRRIRNFDEKKHLSE
ncbi:MAG: helix-turn-helix domain-containing protein [Clostridia bacterium]|nr:helix-turn-helix domain-containing protein [Clostridia bacterium]